jgi:predicted nucleic acid-binding protein
MSLVLDCSLTMAWLYAEETIAAVRKVFELVEDGGAWVPSLWRLEVANVLELGVRRGRSDSVFRDAALDDLAEFPIAIDAETDHRAWTATLSVAIDRKLTVYDAAYLELAKRRRLPLATLDNDLRRAAAAEGVHLLGM